MQDVKVRWQPAYAAACLLATVQFVWVYLSRTRSELNLPAFEQGMERTPFQCRFLLMAPLRWAHESAALGHWAGNLSRLTAWFPGGVRPEDMAQAGLDCASILVAAACARSLYIRSSQHGLLSWMVWPLVVSLCFLTYAAQAHHAIRFPYDLPSMALFSTALLLIYTGGHPVLLSAVFAVATLNRETTLLLLPFLVLRDRVGQVPFRRTAMRAFPLLLFWIAEHLWAAHRFRVNPSAAAPRFLLNLGSLLIPLSWPQALGALGFSWPFFYIFRRSIPDPILRSWLHGYWVWLLFMCVFGLLVEPRVFGELIPLTACLSILLLEEHLAAAFARAAAAPG